MRAILETEDLVKYYGSGSNTVRAIDHTTLKIEAGEFTSIVGRSGSGKSTLLHMLGGLDRPDSGKVYIEGKDIFSLKDDSLVGSIPQEEDRLYLSELQSDPLAECMGKYRPSHRAGRQEGR